MKFFKDIYEVYIRELMKIVKDINLISIFLVAPIIYPLLYGAIYMDKVEENIPIAYKDEDNSSLSRGLIRQIDAHQNIKVAYRIYEDSEIERDLMYEKAKAVLIIPKDFAVSIKNGKRTNVNLIAPSGRLIVISDIGIPVSQIVSTYGAKITALQLVKRGVPVFSNPATLQPIKMDFQYMHNPYLTYGDLVLPGLMVIVISQLILIGATAANAKEYGLNKWKDLFSISNNYIAIIIGKIVCYGSLFFFFGLVILGVLSPLYHIQLLQNLNLVFYCGIMGLISSALFGIFLGTYFRHRITVFIILGFSTYPFFMLSGFAWPWLQIPEYMQWVAYCIPLTPFVQSVISVTQMGNDLSYVQPQLWNMLIQIIVYTLLIVYRMNKIKRNPNPKTRLTRYISSLPR